MPLEKPAYRDNLEQILLFSGGKQMLRTREVVKFTGLDHRTIKKLFSIKDDYISAASLAREMSWYNPALKKEA